MRPLQVTTRCEASQSIWVSSVCQTHW
jgi:hypothetical protein